MNNLATTGRLPPLMPTMSQALAIAVTAEVSSRQGYAGNGTDPGHRPTHQVRIPASLQPEARRVADAAAAALQPVAPETLTSWLAVVNAACEYPLSTGEFVARAAAIAEVLANIPAAAFTDDARRNLATSVSRFPSAKQIMDAVKPEAERLTGKLDALRRLAARPAADEPAPKRPAVSPEQKAADEARTEAMVANLKAQVNASERAALAEAKPATLTPAQRAAAFRAIGQDRVAQHIEAAYRLSVDA